MPTFHASTAVATTTVGNRCHRAALADVIAPNHPIKFGMFPSTTRTPRQALSKALKQKGISLVELLIGVLVGLFVVGGAASLFLSNLDSSRRLLLEARLQQDLRAAADLVTRDVRRAGYWTSAVLGVTGNMVNPNQVVASGGSTVSYRLDAPDAAGQQVIFSLLNGRLRLKLGAGTHQDITDPSVMTVTEFAVVEQPNMINLSHLCPTPCSGAGCPSVLVRRYDITITGRSVSDANITRQLKTSVRVRNDNVSGSCAP